jgi:acetoin utilization deacetylase AcuC-like enzyme
MYTNQIEIFYREEQVSIEEVGFSKSPNKPKLLLNWINQNNLQDYFQVNSKWKPFSKKDFLSAHYKKYVDDFFNGVEPSASSNYLDWNKQFADSVKYTNSSLYTSILASIQNPSRITFSPTSGFHHASPDSGAGYCTFSGQVIASLKIWKTLKLAGTYFDLDGHFGNSIEDSREYCQDLEYAIPPGFNINPRGNGAKYLASLQVGLNNVKESLLSGQIDYVVACSGADSLIDDDLGGQVNIIEWIQAKHMIYSMIEEVSNQLGKPIPLTICLFGGYRKDDFNSVLDAHTQDLVTCLNILGKNKIGYQSKYKKR